MSSSSRSFHAPSNRSVATPYTVAPFRPSSTPPAPTTGQTLKESIVSGVGSGVGFSLGSRLVSGLFGAPTLNVAQAAPPSPPPPISTPTHLPAFQQCQHNVIEPPEKLLCMKLFNTDVSYTEFKQCMETSDNQIHVCKEFLPKPN
jgi:hypothetical protein